MSAKAPEPISARGAATIGAACLCLGLSTMALARVGIPYDSPGVGLPFTIHPGTWALLLAFGLVFAGPGFGARLAEAKSRYPGAFLFTPVLVLMVLFAASVQKLPVTALIDTFFSGVVFLVLHGELNARERSVLRMAIHAFMALNAALGIFEFLSGWRLTPYVVAGAPIVNDPRSTALMGHPLLNAGTTGGYVIALALGGDPREPPTRRMAMIGLQLAAMVAFGGRTAIVLAGAALGVQALRGALDVLSGRRFPPAAALGALVLAPALLLGVALAVSKGLLSSFLERFLDDKGSTDARFAIYDLFGHFSWDQLLLGPDQARLAELQRTLGIEYGIENSWIGLMFQYGGLMAGFFVLAYLALLGDFARRMRPGAWAMLLYFLVLSSSAASLSVKSFAFTQFAIVALGVFGAARSPSAVRAPVRARALHPAMA